MQAKRKKVLAALVASALVFGMTPVMEVNAEEAQFEMDTLVVTATKIATKLKDTAANVTVVKRKDLETKNVKSVDEALTQAGVTVEQEMGGPAGLSRISLQGSDQVLVLVDGRRMNWEGQITNGEGSYSTSMLPNVEQIERIEVVRGAASSLYGSSGVGGVVNIITRKGQEAYTRANVEFGSWNSRRYSLVQSGKQGNTGYLLTLGHQTQGDSEYKDPENGEVRTFPNTDFTRKTASLRLDHTLSEGKELSLFFDHLSEHAGYPVAKPGSMAYSANGSRDTVQNNVALAYDWKVSPTVSNHFQVYRNYHHSLWKNFKLNSGILTHDNTADGAEWSQTRKLNDQHTLVGGLDWRNSRVKVPENNLTQDTMRNTGVFLEDRWDMTPQWSLTAGVRRDDHNIYGSNSTWRMSLNHATNENTNVYLSWGEVYHAPTVDHLFQPKVTMPLGMMPGTYTFQGNPTLRPETGTVTTLGVRTRTKQGTLIEASIFRSYLRDAIEWTTTQTMDASGMHILYQANNVARQKKEGLDIAITHPLNAHWDVNVGYSFLAKEEDRGAGYRKDETNNAPNFYRLGLDYHNKKWQANLLGRGASGRSGAAFTSSDYWVWDLGASYQLNPDSKVYAKVTNLTNEAYETTYLEVFKSVGGQPMPARQISVGYEVKF